MEEKLVPLMALQDFRLECTDPDVVYDVNAGDLVWLPNVNASMYEMIFQLLSDGVCELATDLDIGDESEECGGEEYTGHP